MHILRIDINASQAYTSIPNLHSHTLFMCLHDVHDWLAKSLFIWF